MPKLGDGLFGLKVGMSYAEVSSICSHKLLRKTPKHPSETPNINAKLRLFGLKADMSYAEVSRICTHTLLRIRPKSPSPNFELIEGYG